jgi:hypothetical protein
VFRKDVPLALDILGIFDFPPATTPRGSRGTTIVPSQSLALLNSPFVLDSARSLAHRLRKIEPDSGRLDRLYSMLFARTPSEEETSRALTFLARFKVQLDEDTGTKSDNIENVAWTRLCHAMLVSNEFLMIE